MVEEKLVTVFTTGNNALLGLAKSILDDAGIRYFISGEYLQNLMTGKLVTTGYDVAAGPMELKVSESNVEEAKELLKNLSEDQHIVKYDEKDEFKHFTAILSITIIVVLIIIVVIFVKC